jgi:aryl-alcohol dehydrogenase-like predicted oxidoreductase
MAPTRKLADADVFPIGLGGMQMSLADRPDEDRSLRTIHAALDAGANLIDTADSYCIDETEYGHNERLIAKALRGRRDGVIVATKGGHIRPGGAWALDGSPQHLREACERSLRALDTDRIDLYQFHRPDPKVPYAESIGAIKELQDEGKVRWIGISNASVEQIAQARSIAEIVSVQNELSLEFTSPLEKGEVRACEEHGMAFLPWTPLAGADSAVVRGVADEHDVSPQRVALAWLLALSPAMIPIPGASRPETILDSLRAAELELAGEELDAIAASAGVVRV